MKFLAGVGLFWALCGCQGATEAVNRAAAISAATSVSGANLSGTYNLTRVDCYAITSALPVYLTRPLTGTSTIVISGNSLTRTFNGTSCTLSESGTIVFDGVNSYTLNGRTYTNSAPCSADYDSGSSFLSPSGWTVSGSSLTVLNNVTSYYKYSSTELQLRYDGMSATGSPGWCYLVYTKQ